MTIALFTHNAALEGATLSLFALAKNLRSRGHTCIVFSAIDGPIREKYEALHIKFVVDPCCFDQPERANVLHAHLDETHVDATIINTITGFHLVPYIRKQMPRARVIWVIRESEKESYFRKYPGISQKHFDLAHHVVFVARATKERYAAFDKGQFCVIHNGVDTDLIDTYKASHTKMALRQKYRLPPDGKIISCIGTITPRKGQAEFVESALQVQGKRSDRKTTFVLVGKIPNEAAQRYINNVLQKAEWSGVREAFFLFDETADVFDFFRLSDVLVCNSFIESFPRVILEAMAFEVPIVATNIYGIPEQIQHMRHGLLTLPGNTTMLAQNILSMLEIPALAQNLASNAYKRVQEQFTEEKMTNAFADLLAPSPSVLPPQKKPVRNPSVLFLSEASGDTFRYRVCHQAEALRLQGWHTKTLPVEALEERYADDSFSMFILHRVSYSQKVASFIRTVQAKGKIVIFDIDDLLFEEKDDAHLHGKIAMQNNREMGLKESLHDYGKVLALCNAAMVTTHALQRCIQNRFPQMPTFICKNATSIEMRQYAEQAIYERENENPNIITIGYFSGTPSHDVDFLACASSLKKILENYPFVRLRVCGFLQVPSLLLSVDAQIERISFVPWQQVPSILAKTSINLAPLEYGNPFAEAKSELKYLEAAMVGIPTIASATDGYTEAITSGDNGFLCKTPQEWYASLELLLRNASLRKTMGENAKKDMLQRYTTEIRGKELSHLLLQILASSLQKNSATVCAV